MFGVRANEFNFENVRLMVGMESVGMSFFIILNSAFYTHIEFVFSFFFIYQFVSVSVDHKRLTRSQWRIKKLTHAFMNHTHKLSNLKWFRSKFLHTCTNSTTTDIHDTYIKSKVKTFYGYKCKESVQWSLIQSSHATFYWFVLWTFLFVCQTKFLIFIISSLLILTYQNRLISLSAIDWFNCCLCDQWWKLKAHDHIMKCDSNEMFDDNDDSTMVATTNDKLKV